MKNRKKNSKQRGIQFDFASYTSVMHLYRKYTFLLLLLLALFCSSCKKSYLDVVPDNIATIDNAFTAKNEAEKYLFTLYGYLPAQSNPQYNPGLIAGDEIWMDFPALRFDDVVLRIARGEQNTVSPRANYMEGYNGVPSMYKAIRDCNIFIENISNTSKVPDLDADLRRRWIGEAQFLKAFYHFILLRSYGPVPIIDKNISVDAPISEIRVKRQPVDAVVDYISLLLDTAAKKLPLTILNKTTELGRITQPVALSMKARLLTMAASPLFNGNSDYNSFKDKDGVALFNPSYDPQKWKKAADACKAAIDICNSANIKLYTFPAQLVPLSATTTTEMSFRNAVSESWNSELIWGLTTNNNTNLIQSISAGQYDPANATKAAYNIQLGPTLKMAKLFYTKNGVPIGEDKTLDFSKIEVLRTGTHDERFDIAENYQTARLNFDREPRFYASLGFDGGVWYMANSPSLSDENTWHLESKVGQYGATSANPITGYYMKKLLNWHFEWSNYQFQNYAWPEMRLADLYLLYAEALNEFQGPTADVYEYVNRIRARSGLQTVQTAWSNFSTNPTKFTTKEGMRLIIQQERGIELSFEGQRYWDLLRWKKAGQELNGNITGWDIRQTDADLYYRETTFYSRHFIVPRDYLTPIQENNLLVNENLVQNPNW
ncbi:RagB/SusD family nutrient uptake outer membrane protein [uncultured Pedobacter sp.]|uniref:RagB/SusD family nutrient uptake outer membrane protein n=1 Tax=uncultured Pedobacter sp. TaxID=246139 RepID=UPI0025E2C40D|nr:RagB/SusD family nutrient uptake outer membrane protein [uncultured Pedobacter sp.]